MGGRTLQKVLLSSTESNVRTFVVDILSLTLSLPTQLSSSPSLFSFLPASVFYSQRWAVRVGGFQETGKGSRFLFCLLISAQSQAWSGKTFINAGWNVQQEMMRILFPRLVLERFFWEWSKCALRWFFLMISAVSDFCWFVITSKLLCRDPIISTQDVQLHGRGSVLWHRGEHPAGGLRGDRLLDAVSPLWKLCPPGSVEVLHVQQVLHADRQHRWDNEVLHTH